MTQHESDAVGEVLTCFTLSLSVLNTSPVRMKEKRGDEYLTCRIQYNKIASEAMTNTYWNIHSILAEFVKRRALTADSHPNTVEVAWTAFHPSLGARSVDHLRWRHVLLP